MANQTETKIVMHRYQTAKFGFVSEHGNFATVNVAERQADGSSRWFVLKAFNAKDKLGNPVPGGNKAQILAQILGLKTPGKREAIESRQIYIPDNQLVWAVELNTVPDKDGNMISVARDILTWVNPAQKEEPIADDMPPALPENF